MGEEFTIIFERAAVARALLNVCASGLDYQEDTYDCICDTDNMTMKVLAYDWHIRSGVTFQISQAAGELTAILTTGTPVGLVHIPVATMLPHAITATDPHQGDPILKMVIPYPPPASGSSSVVIEYRKSYSLACCWLSKLDCYSCCIDYCCKLLCCSGCEKSTLQLTNHSSILS
eukprot:m.25485 g.25485  ORF g.25485 m.25485 type:complete len:174 (-) comp11605_c0_seq3:763-1284(-)